MNSRLTTQATFVTLPAFQVIEQGPSASAMLNRFQQWLRDGGYAQVNVTTYVSKARWLLSLLPDPGILGAPPDVVINQLKCAMEQHSGLSPSMKQTGYLILKKLQEFLYFERGLPPPTADPLALPARLAELPEWLREPLGRHLRLKQRNWPAAIVQHQTQGLFGRLYHISQFFIQEYGWTEWSQLSMRWIDGYVDSCLRRQRSPTTINCILFAFQGFCRFLTEEGCAIPSSMTRIQALDVPHRIARPLPNDQVRQLEQTIQSARGPQSIFDLAWFYLLWHCGLRVSEIHHLRANDLDLNGHKLWVRLGKERKDRLVYLSDTAVHALQHHLNIRVDRDAIHVFTLYRRPITTRAIQRRLSAYGQRIGISVSPHRLRHTFASQMLAAGMPVTSLSRYLGHDNINITMLYAEVSDPMLQRDYYRGITLIDPESTKLSLRDERPLDREELRQLFYKLQSLDPASQDYAAALEYLQRLLETIGGEQP